MAKEAEPVSERDAERLVRMGLTRLAGEHGMGSAIFDLFLGVGILLFAVAIVLGLVLLNVFLGLAIWRLL